CLCNAVLGADRRSKREKCEPRDYRVKRPKKSLQPFPLLIHDCRFAARSRSSVRPMVRRVRGLAPESGSFIFASVCSFLSGVDLAWRAPNSFSASVFFFIVCTVDGGHGSSRAPRR